MLKGKDVVPPRNGRIRSRCDERPTHSKMWSSLKKIFRRFLGEGQSYDHSSLLPQDIDKLRHEFTAREELDGPGGPITAREAFELALEIITTFDKGARLASLYSEGAMNEKGRADGWIFSFLLPDRRGHAQFRFNNIVGQESLMVQLLPFAPAGSALDKMLDEGQAGFVEQQWKVELDRQHSLSHGFRDSDEVLRAWKAQGKVVNFAQPIVLRAVTPPLGAPRWELLESPGSKKSIFTLPLE